MYTVAAWLLGSNIGRYLLLGILSIVVVSIVILKIKADTTNNVMKKIALENALDRIKIIQDKVQSDKTIHDLPIDRKRDLLRKWATS